MQKQVAIDKIIGLSQAIPAFGDFINSMGLETILDNLDIRGIEHLKAQSVVYMKQLEEQKKMAAENPQPDPTLEATKMTVEAGMQIEMAKIEQQKLKAEGDNSVAVARVAVEKQKADTQFAALMANVEQNTRKLDIEEEKVASEDARTAVEAAMEITKHHHAMNREKIDVEIES